MIRITDILLLLIAHKVDIGICEAVIQNIGDNAQHNVFE